MCIKYGSSDNPVYIMRARVINNSYAASDLQNDVRMNNIAFILPLIKNHVTLIEDIIKIEAILLLH